VNIVARLRSIPSSVLKEWLLLTICLVVLTGVLAHFKVLSRLDAWWYDSIISTRPIMVPSDVVLINVEPDTLDGRDVSRRQWTKADTAVLLGKLSESTPVAIYLDDPLHIVDANDSVGEAVLSESIKRNGKVVLPVYLVTERSAVTGFRLPTPSHANFSAALSQARITIAPDGITRALPMAITNGDIEWLHVSAVLAEFSLGKGAVELPPTTLIAHAAPGWLDDRQMLLRGLPTGESFTTVTARQVLNGEISTERFANKIIFAGLGSQEGNIAIPGHWGRAQIVSRLELFAHALNTIRTRSWPIALNDNLVTIASCALVLILLLLYLTLADLHGFITTLLMIVLIAVLSWMLLAVAGMWFSLAASLCVSAVAYPLWAWRRLAATHRFVAFEIKRMRREPGILGEANASPFAPAGALIDQQLQAIQEATEKLRIGRTFIAQIIESLPIAVAVLDKDGKVMLCNNEAASLLLPTLQANEISPVNNLIGRSMIDAIHASQTLMGDDQATINKPNIPTLIAEGIVIRQASVIELATHRSFWLVAEPLRDPNTDHSTSLTHVAGVVALADISALKQAERHREELLRFVSHDMRSPLASILALIELRKEVAGSATDDERFAEITGYARHTISLAEEFLRIVYAAASDEATFQNIDLGTSIEAALDLVRALAQERNIKLDYQGDDSTNLSASFRGNHNLLVRMFANLLDNAIKFGPANSQVTIRLIKSAHSWLIEICDQGQQLPITADATENLFKPYSQLSQINTQHGSEKSRSIGLGLAFVKVVAQKHNGTITLEKQASGTRAVVCLPDGA
jgi:signal transduction histidine kinase/CHASE2 domain-containing sensor protein